MAGEQRPGGTRQLGHWLGDQLSNTTPPNGHYRHEYLMCMYVFKKEEADFLTWEERGLTKKNILSDATLYNKLKELESTCIIVRSQTPLVMSQFAIYPYYLFLNKHNITVFKQ